MQNDTTQPAARRRLPFGPLFRWFFTWRVLRRFVAGVVILITVVALFYAEEDWRGKRAWEKAKHEAESKGVVLDWAAYIPPPVPDDQNIFKAPRMTEWFVGRGINDLGRHLSGGPVADVKPATGLATKITLADLIIVPTGTQRGSNQADVVLRLDDPAAPAQAEQVLQTVLGPAAPGAQGGTFMLRRPDQIKPVHILLLAEKTPSFKEMREFFTTNTISGVAPRTPFESSLEVEAADANSYRIVLTPAPVVAADYLAWSDPSQPDFDLIREALKRPYARMDGDYRQSYAMPIPNFLAVRIVAQVLSQRAVCQLLLDQPDKALREMTLLHDLSRLLEARPTGKPMTLVAAMINVAITGIYTQTITGGFQLHAWREPQLVQLQQQLSQIDLPPMVAESLRTEQAGPTHMLETASPTAVADQRLNLMRAPKNLRERLKDPMFRFWVLAPRGWIYQNMAAITRFKMGADGYDPVNNLILPRQAQAVADNMVKSLFPASPYTFLAAMMVPNYVRASQVLALNQTRANEALIACALERFHFTNGQYPETLAALSPQFLEKIPHDLIGGQPLKYRRTDDGGFLLYSVGWNEKDDGGTVVMTVDNSQGDWVWPQYPVK